MHMYQRRRPSPIFIAPRQEPTPSGAPKSPDSPDSPDTPPGVPQSPDSPDPSPTASTFPGSQKPASPTFTAAPTVTPNVSSVSTQPATTSQAVTSAPFVTSSNVPASSSIASTASVPAQQITQAPSSTQIAVPTNTNVGAVPDSGFSSKKAGPSVSSTTTEMVASHPIPTTTAAADNTPAIEPTTLPQKQAQHQARTMSIGAEAALITCSVIGAFALIIGAIIMLKRRRRKNAISHTSHAPDAFDPSNTGSLHAPETVHVALENNSSGSHFTASTRTESIFAAGIYARPETVSTPGSSRIAPIAPPQQTPNPFVDPSLNKSYDVLRGRPRSTTLTDRGSWVDNPFKDPMSERFDPFGELQQKARDERKKYLAQLRREDEVRREQEMLAKERMGLGMPGRKGSGASGVTVEGVGVLPRSGDGKGTRR